MRNALRFVVIGLAAIALAGCFTSKGSLYAGVTPLRPFHDGERIASIDDKGNVSHSMVREVTPGAYLSDDQLKSDRRECSLVRFYPLPSVAGTLVMSTPFCDLNAKGAVRLAALDSTASDRTGPGGIRRPALFHSEVGMKYHPPKA